MLRNLWSLFLGFFVYALIRKISSAVEAISYKNKIIFNTVWEDPRVDREALKLTEDDVVMTISSAGCNALSFLLDNPKHIYLVDRNPCQNALVELKLAAIKILDFDTFWKLFGEGVLPEFSTKYYPRLRDGLSPQSQQYWDAKSFYFDGTGMKRSFYWRGTCGTMAWCLSWYCRLVPGLGNALDALFDASDLDQQKVIYDKFVAPRLWNQLVSKLIRSELYLSWTGIPQPQQKLLASTAGEHATIGAWIKAQIDYVFTQLPASDNYFWRVYFYGRYIKECCPDYLKEENFEILKSRVERISITTDTITGFLNKNPHLNISTFVLLDHMDWMAEKPELLEEEWAAILKVATENAQVLWRSAAEDSTFVLDTKVTCKGKETSLSDVIKMDLDIPARLHQLDRVHTYTSMHVGSIRT